MGSLPQSSPESHEFNPLAYPPFPPTAQPCIDLETISYRELQAGNISERTRLFSICRDKGFFHLDISDTPVESLRQDAEAIMVISEDFHKLSHEEKMTYLIGQKQFSILGFKPAGFVKQDAYGKKGDTVEIINCGKDDVADIPGRVPVKLPPMFAEPSRRNILDRFQSQSHEMGLTILSALATELGLAPDAFEEMHRFDRPSDSHTRMTRSPPRAVETETEISSPGHTDFGSVTLLWNWLGGLQVWSESNRGESYDNGVGSDLGPDSVRKGEWLWVKPKPGHIIVNLGDCTVKHSGGLLCAGRHRVVDAPGEQGKYPRYSLVYFVRPADDQVLKRLKGGMVPPLKQNEVEEDFTALQWVARQFKNLQVGATKE